jgi:hypothetical protein
MKKQEIHFCEYCEKELSEEKGELAHGCLNCHYAPWVYKIDKLRKALQKIANDKGPPWDNLDFKAVAKNALIEVFGES